MTKKGIIITGIVLPILVGITLMIIERTYFSPDKKDITKPEYSPKKETVVTKKELPKSTQPPIEKEIPTDNTVIAINEKYKKQFQLAKKIWGSTERNTEYFKIIEAALSELDLQTALTVTKEVWGSTERNEQYFKIIDLAIKKKEFDLAEKTADLVWGSTERNTQYQKILKASSLEIESNEKSL